MKQLFFLFLLIGVQCALVSETFEEKLAASVHFQEGVAPTIGRIMIDDMKSGINESTWIYVHAALEEYKRTKPGCIILELNTPGGEVYAAQRISDALKEMDTQYGIPVIAYINNWAISAGAMLAYSCRFIVIAKDASMGAAEPVFFGQEGQMKEASEKVNSALRSDFANRAKFFGRNGDIAEKMVDKDLILVERQGKIIRLISEDEIIKAEPTPDIIISPKGKLLTLNAEQLIQYGVADQMLPPIKLEPLTLHEEESGTFPVTKSAIGEIPFFAASPARIETYQMNWQTRFFAFLANPMISSILFLGLMVGFYMEMSSPGFGVPGLIALLSLFFIVLSSFAMQAIGWLEPILLLFGLFLIFLELFFFPTMGILGVLGALFMMAGLIGMMVPGIGAVSFDGESINAAGEYVLSRLGYLSGALLVSCVIIGLLSRYMTPKLRVMQKIVLSDTPLLAAGQAKNTTPLQIGEIALVTATLRPAGKISIHHVEYDAISTGGFIEKGKSVRVIDIQGDKIITEESYS